jgi:hypothetical protein
VTFSVAGRSVGASKAAADGAFDAPLDVSRLPVGSYEVEARCGPVQYANLDVVLATQVSHGTATVVIIVLFVLLGVGLYWRRLAHDR